MASVLWQIYAQGPVIQRVEGDRGEGLETGKAFSEKQETLNGNQMQEISHDFEEKWISAWNFLEPPWALGLARGIDENYGTKNLH